MAWRRTTGVLLRCLLVPLAVAAGVLAYAGPAETQIGWVKRKDRAAEPSDGWRRPGAVTPAQPDELELKATADSLERIEAGVENLQEARLSPEPVTDVLIRIRPGVHRYRGQSTETTTEAERSYIEAHILVVTRGRINPAGMARCDRFEGDVLVCSVECDGGEFGLRRGGLPGEHYLIVGSGGAGTQRAGFRLGSCASRTAPSLLLMPRTGRLAAEVKLIEQR
jgi:hypothetical protein